MLDPLIQAETDYIKNSGQKPSFIILGRKQLKMIENLVNELTAQKMVVFDENYANTSKWRDMIIKKSEKEDYIGFL